MTEEEIWEIVKAFGEASRRAKEAVLTRFNSMRPTPIC